MRKVSTSVRNEILSDERSGKCMRSVLLGDHECRGRITWEHAIIFGGRQLDKRWAIIQICEYAHGVGRYQDCGIMDKEINHWIALNLATDDELRAVSKAIDYVRKREYLNSIHGKPDWKRLARKEA